MFTKSVRIALVAAAFALPSLALAKGTTQTHHCKMPDGTMDATKTHKQCTAAKGTWVKDAPAAPKDAGKADPGSATPPAPSPAPAK